MNCAKHNDVPAAAYCRTCGKALCENCKRDVKGVIYCDDCVAAHAHEANPAAVAVPAQTVVVASAPSPGLAGVLAFFLPFGIGQLYNRQYGKAVVYMLLFAFLVFANANSHGLEPLPGLVLAFFIVYQIFDAVRTAKALQMAQPVPDTLGLNKFFGIQLDTPTRTWSPTAPIGAIVLIGIGVLFLLGNFGWIHIHGFGDWWPVILIAAGIGLFFRRQPVCGCVRCRAQLAMWPAVLVTIGVLAQLDTLGVKDFSATWPVLLVVVGIVKFLQTSGPTAGHVEGDGYSEPPPPNGPQNQEVSNA